MIHARGYAEQTQTPERLVRAHMDLVRRIAWNLHARIGRKVEIDDLIQVGYMGLVDASRRYEPREGVSFAAYAAIRIRGSIMDFLRSNSALCRTTILMQQKVKAAVQRLEGRLMRAPETPEVAAELSMPVGEYQDWLAQFAGSQTASLDEVYDDQSALFEGHDPSAEDRLQASQMRGLLRQALGRMPEREALLLQLIFVEELNVYEVGEILGVTTGRVSQIKKAAIERLRGLIDALQGEV
ncbi:FliA/WhiG family RNA polymerase sigma factor [Rhodobacter sphaeroides]|jgi:RNA polymerase, sigma 28 subunit, SigD/FliA/WhiG|uniref:RNA polymerase, sigma 28 subunit, SigD/FliA/WhiG n=2 Tax=Cereibacter sphaeroides TaxID=1063 RepID=Q3J1Y3_CERS4|nr:FliA/WhiG family RNA polymerase sigma factor [Cereibacter sphaeroides]ABN76772.1 RNA polymerase, sigma 28 subunit, FliA/WhiG family [Cereibacter sphaeroides ATCC 17029]EKX57631.1 RNA polymerase sigma factor for flagellar operon [Rhodobacter sp. AKP1]ABA79201.1 RNA polymerase, sigma 28 subunit, SigD/FliA/WhiG [Cereibacter sphaeroides 2.4.1]AMJ47502.1 RNA polymerase subunit sigma-70 [Cereibacter sphaeroides]ANS34214.1 RNA polymerase subunit sigma-70 [Cereibacter sphaeroides]